MPCEVGDPLPGFCFLTTTVSFGYFVHVLDHDQHSIFQSIHPTVLWILPQNISSHRHVALKRDTMECVSSSKTSQWMPHPFSFHSIFHDRVCCLTSCHSSCNDHFFLVSSSLRTNILPVFSIFDFILHTGWYRHDGIDGDRNENFIPRSSRFWLVSSCMTK